MILNVNKEANMTSRDVVNIISRHFNTKKVGHTGTLDPIASGVLIICIGKDTKLVDLITSNNKEYVATMKLGIKTDTADITGNILEKKSYKVTKEAIIKVLNSFLGISTQTVPIYSAVRINGKRLYEYARNDQEVTLPQRQIEIFNIDLLDYHDDLIKFRVTVSKGTYIRSLIEDIAKKLNTVGTMTNLVRTKQGLYKIADSNTIESIENNKFHEITYEELFAEYEKYELNDDEYHLVKNGQKMPINFKKDLVVYTYNNKYIAIYHKDNDIARITKMLH